MVCSNTSAIHGVTPTYLLLQIRPAALKVNANMAKDAKYLPFLLIEYMRSAIARGAANQRPIGLKAADSSNPLKNE
jgi:hypothetical protein